MLTMLFEIRRVDRNLIRRVHRQCSKR